MKKAKKLSDKEKDEVCSLYENYDHSYTSLSKKFKVSKYQIKKILNERGYKTKKKTILSRQYKVNESYFDKIDNSKKAYILGFLYADGYHNEAKNAIRLKLHVKDIDILYKINSIIQPTKPLSSCKYDLYYAINIGNEKISKSLKKHGCTQKKTNTLKFPSFLKEKLIPHFIRGYCDGDGYISKKEVNILSTKEFCEELASVIKKNIGVSVIIRKIGAQHDGNIRGLCIYGINNIRKFLLWIYNRATLYLDRKHDTAKRLI
jgi:hypothetical protein